MLIVGEEFKDKTLGLCYDSARQTSLNATMSLHVRGVTRRVGPILAAAHAGPLSAWTHTRYRAPRAQNWTGNLVDGLFPSLK